MLLWRLALLLLTYAIRLADTVDIKNFVPFGLEHGDETVEHEPNTITEPIFISVRYPFFDTHYDQIRVSTHGLIILGNSTDVPPLKTPDQFPLADLVCVAPYWVDTNIAQDSISDIFYRQILVKNEPDTLYQITKMARNGFPKFAAQRMLWALIITWYQVSGHKEGSGRNTYQAILTSNGLYSFTLFTYHQLEWSEGLSGGYPEIGFNAGDEINYFKLKKSFTPEVVSIVKDSNVGVPGQFIFHTTGNVSDVQCETNSGLQSTPFRGSIYGGYELRLHGICFNESAYIVHIDEHVLEDCHVLNSLYLICVMPMLMDSGRIKIELFSKDDRRLIDTTDFLVHVPDDNGELILSNYADLQHQIADHHNDELVLHFQSNAVTRKYLFHIIIYDYATQLFTDNQTLHNRTRHRIDLGLGNLNLSAIGNLAIRYDTIFHATSEPADRVHALQISFEMVQTNEWLRSAFFVGAKIFTAAASLHVAYCPAWLLIQRDPLYYIEQIPPCPCRVPVSSWPEDFMGFRIDNGCDGRKPLGETCAYHNKARGCYRKRSQTSWSGAQCCYDEEGNFLEQGKEGAGTLDVVSPDLSGWFGSRISMFGHFFADFLSYWSCCKGLIQSEQMCKAYYNYRPAGRCEDMEAESTEKHGDPHFVTLNGTWYTFHGHGEYTLISLPGLGGQEVQVRLAPVGDEAGTNRSTGIVAFAIGLRGKKRVQFELFAVHQLLEIRIDARLIEPPHEEFAISLLVYEDEHVSIKRDINGSFEISLPASPLRFRVHIRSSFDSLELETILERDKFIKLATPSFGLLGDLIGLMFPNGTRMLTNTSDESSLFEYGESWRISRNSSLFYHPFGDRHIQQQPSFVNRHGFLAQIDGDTSTLALVQQSCSGDRSQQQGGHCEFDVLVVDADADANGERHLYNSNQKHWESLTVTIEQDDKPERAPSSTTKSGSADLTIVMILSFAFLCSVCL